MAGIHLRNWLNGMRSANRALIKRGIVSVWSPRPIEGWRKDKIFRKQLSWEARLWVAKRDGFRCAYCGLPSVLHESIKAILPIGHIPVMNLRPFLFEVDHIIPCAKGGSNDPDNLCLACGPCNRRKAKRDVETFRMQMEGAECQVNA